MVLKLIMVGTDGSERAERAVERAAELAHSEGAELRIVAVHPVPYDTDETEAIEGRQELLEPLAERLRSGGLEVRVHVMSGDPAGVLTSLADELRADTLVIGDRGSRGLHNRLLGSVAARVIHSATVPVVVVPTA
jgi:nucleotide-binding universal stress UspA family protein